ncbi:hypothetical protein TL18_07660 [Methanobrevibacter sp. YE315]|uniref:hypothetical protein n=1 Tax=Methanobrevibacter sp. YE315 TaxID=1609968 RepID=UPI000764E8BB|nr:hypothetical protein [Methanobrevibacter sp. YE315]AMD17911.1 hypothetical protein TL18_07660 [Methanobrevibacter sp. YE315]
MNVLNNLQKRNNSLKSKLRHEQLKYGNYSFKVSNKELLLVLDAYKTEKSLIKAASSVGVDKNIALNSYIQGRDGNPKFRPFYLAINDINGVEVSTHKDIISQVEEIENSYNLIAFDDAWVYTTHLDGEKISIISSDLDSLKKKVKDRNLPLV